MQVCARLILIFAVMACPLNCMGALSESDAPSMSTSACGCCSHHAAERDSEPVGAPDSPNHDCPCPTCLCNGAVLLADDVAFDLSSIGSHDWAVVSIVDLSGASTSSSAACDDWCQDHSILRPAGRAARILHQSFLL